MRVLELGLGLVLIPLHLPTPAPGAGSGSDTGFQELMKGMQPSLGPFSDALGPKLVMIMGFVWILCLAATVLLMMKGGMEFAAARGGGRPMAAADGVMDIGVPTVALIFLGIIPAVVQALI